MKDSGIEWIGEIPEDWEISKFKNSSNLYVGDSIKDNEKDNYLDKDDAKAYVATKDLIIDENMVDFSNTLYVKNDNIKFKTAPKDSSLICIEGGSAGRKKAFLDRDVCFVNKLCCINPLNSMDKKYMFYLISNQAFEQEFDKYIQGLIGGVSINKLSNFNIPLPTLKEQHKISSFLDNEVNKINISIGYIYEQIENLKNYKKSVITEAVTKGLDKNVEMKDSEIEWIGEIPKHWKVVPLKRLAIYNQGTLDEFTKKDYEFEYIDISSVKYGKGILPLETMTFEKAPSRARRIVHDGDIIISTVRTYLKAIATVPSSDKQMIASTGFCVVRTNGIIEQGFLKYSVQSEHFISEIASKSTGVSYPAINSTDLVNIKVLVPTKSERLEIIKYLDKKTKLIDESIAIKQKQLETLEEYKKSLIYEYVTGKKEVKDGEET